MKQSSPTGNAISRRSVRRLAAFFSLALALYLCIGLASLPRPGQETFPCYSWFLFAKVPNGSQEFTIRLLSVKGQIFDPPLPFRQAKGFVQDRKSIVAHRVIETFAQALVAKDNETAEIQRRLLESNYLKPGTVYEVIRESYNPLELWRAGKDGRKKIETIAIFQTSTP
jgi:hypothetical protein